MANPTKAAPAPTSYETEVRGGAAGKNYGNPTTFVRPTTLPDTARGQAMREAEQYNPQAGGVAKPNTAGRGWGGGYGGWGGGWGGGGGRRGGSRSSGYTNWMQALTSWGIGA